MKKAFARSFVYYKSDIPFEFFLGDKFIIIIKQEGVFIFPAQNIYIHIYTHKKILMPDILNYVMLTHFLF